MVLNLLLFIVSCLLASLLGYIIHWAIHQSWSGKLNKAHMTHHLKLYPPEDYSSEVYRSADKDNTVKIFAFIAIPIIAIVVIVGVLLKSFVSIVLILLGIGVVSFLSNYLHDAFHIRNHILSRIPIVRDWFGRWNELHLGHHRQMNKNFGIFWFGWDRLLGTFLR